MPWWVDGKNRAFVLSAAWNAEQCVYVCVCADVGFLSNNSAANWLEWESARQHKEEQPEEWAERKKHITT